MFQILLLLFVFVGRSAAVIYKLNVSEYNKMPALYDMDDYEACMAEAGGMYCVVDVNLQEGTNPELMDMIQGYSEHKMKHFNHTQIHRAVCVTKTCKDFLRSPDTNSTWDLRQTLEECLNNSLYSQYRLEGKLDSIQYCKREGERENIDYSDVIMAVVYIVLIMLNVVGSLYDVLLCKEEKTGNPYLLAFSLRRNWSRLIAPNNSGQEPRLERLKQFHGLRTMTMFCVFFSHTTLIMSFSYVDNPLYIETSYEDPLKQILFNGSLVTHTFFVMSSFLLAYNFQLYAEKHPVSWWQFPKGILLRWLRLTPTYALVMFSIATWMRHGYQGPLWQLVVTSEANACRQYWWAQLLYVNNYVYDDAFCMPQTWYLAADTQLFIMGLLVCVVARTCKTRAILLTSLFVLALALVAGHTYFQDLEAVVIQSPESYRNLYASDLTFRLLYIRGHTNMSTYLLGLAGGFLAYHCQTNNIDMDKYKKYRWAMWLVFPLGVAVILSGGLFYLDSGRAAALYRVMYATAYKPVFQLLVVSLILGCIFKFESVYRGIIEWRGWTWTGRVSYSAFLLHTVFQRGLVGAQAQPIHMSDYCVMTVLAGTIFLTYLCACALWLGAEAPAAALARTLLSAPKKEKEAQDVTKV
ncbi:nose resistant to fluoxetine protein 6-like [Helicoverpa zea]|uniref:nose resistant to fluoxetine protein 6-like n=1 Tax=Helicoverpa zea TaxID=7113 RepID=UPI001F568E22|nr:nose resistant to fluoxetine protein 6-like [Helicoverpa zea]